MTELIVNGDAEQGLTGWLTVAGAPVVLRYDTGQGYPGPGDPGPAQRGSSFFGGGNTPLTTLRQSVTLAPAGRLSSRSPRGLAATPRSRTAPGCPSSSSMPPAHHAVSSSSGR